MINMTTLHLVYNTLANVFDNKQGVIRIIKRRKKIKNILEECCSLPSVIDDIIYGYTDEVIELDNYIDVYSNTQNNNYLFRIALVCNNLDIMICIFSYQGKIIYNIQFMSVYLQKEMELYAYNYIKEYNAFMKHFYHRDNYMNCDYKNNNNIEYIFRKHMIEHRIDQNIYTNLVYNHKEYTHFIVMIKCIIKGIQKYFQIHDILDYYTMCLYQE